MCIVGLALVFPSCDSSSPVDNTNNTSVDAYLASLPHWDEFCPPGVEHDATQVGDPVDEDPVTVDVDALGDTEAGNYTIEDVTYACQTKTYSLAQNPEKIVIFDPDGGVLYAGALIQGKNHANGSGSIQPLSIAQRAPVRVSIPELPTGDNFRLIVPNQATVAAAKGEMIGNAMADGLATPSSIDFKVANFHSEQQWGLDARVSGRYLKFRASASGSYEETAATTTIAAQFYQKMFTVVVEAPQSPGSFFSDDFTPALLQDQIDLGRIGPDNIPVYVASVVYGRMMMFSMTSTASAEEMEGTITAAYNGIEGDINASLTARQRNILVNSQMSITSIGGPAQATIDAIKSGNWKDYFTEECLLSEAVPISYTLRNLGDDSIAAVTETTTYNIRECTAGSGTFSFGGDGEANYIRPTVPPPARYEEFNFLYQLSDGDCDFHGYPVTHFIVLQPQVDERTIRLVPDQDLNYGSLAVAYREGDSSGGGLLLDALLFTAPPGWRIARVQGMSPADWMSYAGTSQLGTALRDINNYFTICGIWKARLIGDLVGDDFVDCTIPAGKTPTGIFALTIEETQVELECIDCN